jgi:hypothetical protein
MILIPIQDLFYLLNNCQNIAIKNICILNTMLTILDSTIFSQQNKELDK